MVIMQMSGLVTRQTLYGLIHMIFLLLMLYLKTHGFREQNIICAER